MYRTIVWTVIVILLSASLAVAQGQPDETPGDRPDGTASPTQDGSGDPGADRRDDAPTSPGDTRAPTSPDDTRGPPVEIDDARDGFGSRPTEAGAQRPAFSYNASRAALAMERTGAPGMDAAVDAVIEFRDEDGDGAYDVGEPVLQRLALRDLDMQIRAPSDERRDAVYTLPDNGSLILRFHLAPDGADEAAKFDVVFDRFPFTDETSRVAIGLRAEAKGGLRLGSVDGAPAVLAEGSGEQPFLSWLANASADGEEVDVAASMHVAAEGDDALVYWAYPQAAMIVHDPLMGYVSVPLDRLGDAAVFSVALVVGGVFMLAGYEARRRFRR